MKDAPNISNRAFQYSDHHSLMYFLADDGTSQAINSPDESLHRRRHILLAMQDVMGDLPGESRRVEPVVEVVREEDLGAYTRCELTLAVESNDRLPAFLLIPKDLHEPTPGILCLHQTNVNGKSEPAGVMGAHDLQYAAHLAERGYVTLVPDYPLAGYCNNLNYEFDWRGSGYASATMKGIWNHMRCVDFLQSLPQVDPNRIGCIGHSLGGHNTLFAGAFDDRIKVMVTSAGFTSFPKYEGGDVSNWAHEGYMPRIASVYHSKGHLVPFDFSEILGVLAPRPVFISAPLHDFFEVSGVIDCVAAARPIYELFGANDKLSAIHPDCGHDFPEEARTPAYAWLDRWLR